MATTRNIRSAILEVGETYQFTRDVGRLEIIEALVDGQVMGFAESMREMRDAIEDVIKLPDDMKIEFRADFRNKALVIVARALAHWLDNEEPPPTTESTPPTNITQFTPKKKP